MNRLRTWTSRFTNIISFVGPNKLGYIVKDGERTPILSEGYHIKWWQDLARLNARELQEVHTGKCRCHNE